MPADLSDEGQIGGAVRARGRILLADQSLEQTLEMVATSACESIGSHNAASIALRRRERLEARVPTSDVGWTTSCRAPAACGRAA